MAGAPPRFWYPHDYTTDVKGWSPPRWLNPQVVLGNVRPAPKGSAVETTQTILRLLVASDGEIAGGCVEKSFGNQWYDWNALHVMVKEGRFRPAHLKNGDAVQAWVSIVFTASRSAE